MKKLLAKLALSALALTTIVASPVASAQEKVEKLTMGFVPSRDPQEIVAATEPLEQLLIDELKKLGFEIGDLEITVGTSYETVGEGLTAGTIDVGFIPGGTYVLYDDGAEVLLTATRAGLSNDSDKPADWNQNEPTEAKEEQVQYYRALAIAGPSEKGKELADKVNKGEELTWEDLDSAKWSIMSPSSPAGYIYPALQLKNKYDKSLSDLKNAVQSDSYLTAFSRLASGQVDVLLTYADARRDYVEKWQKELGAKNDIWADTDLIMVTDKIFNDTVSVSKKSKTLTPELKEAIAQALINITQDEKGKEVVKAIYSHEGYVKANDADYDNERKAQELLLEEKN